MSKDKATPRDRVLGAFKGLIRSHEIEGVKANRLSRDPSYSKLMTLFYHKDHEAFQLHYKKQAFARLLSRLEELHPGQIGRSTVSRYVKQAFTEWVDTGHNSSDSAQLEQAAQDFLQGVEGEL